MMKNGIKKLVFGALFVGVGLGADQWSLEEYNSLIKTFEGTMKQMLICEREALYIRENPHLCIKAAKAGEASNGTKENEIIASQYYNAGVIYWEKQEYEKAISMHRKALEFQPDFPLAHQYLVVAYRDGLGVPKDNMRMMLHGSYTQGFAVKSYAEICKDKPHMCK